MGQLFHIHPENPQGRLLAQAAAILYAGGIIAYPTDSCYALGCQMESKEALTRLTCIRKINKNHNFTLICRDLKEIAQYAVVESRSAFRILKRYTPGPYTFVLKASRDVPRRIQSPKRKTIGIRVPQHKVIAQLLAVYGHPIMSTTLQLPDEELPLADPEDIYARLGKQIDLVIEDGGPQSIDLTTVVDLTTEPPSILRQGIGKIDLSD